MKRLIISLVMSMGMLTGCGVLNTSISQIGEVGGAAVIQAPLYHVEEENIILFSDLEKEFQKNSISFKSIDMENDEITRYDVEDDQEIITMSLDTITSLSQQIVTRIDIDNHTDRHVENHINNQVDSQMALSEHPVVKMIASLMGEEELTSWVADQEEKSKKTGIEDDPIQELLILNRSYISYEYWPGSDGKSLIFTWAPKPHISMEFEQIATELEERRMLITDYIEGAGGSTLTATNSDYYLLTRRGYNTEKKIDSDIGQAVSYRVMHDSKSGNYSVQLYGYMMEDLSYITEVETMPGLDQLTQMMGMGQDDFLAITGAINKELTEARKLQNENLRRDTYVEGSVGAYHYTINVPQGWGTYRFTVLIEEK